MTPGAVKRPVLFVFRCPCGNPHRSPVRGGGPLLGVVRAPRSSALLGTPRPPLRAPPLLSSSQRGTPVPPPNPRLPPNIIWGFLTGLCRGRRSPQAGRAAPQISDLREGNRGAWGVARSAVRGGRPTKTVGARRLLNARGQFMSADNSCASAQFTRRQAQFIRNARSTLTGCSIRASLTHTICLIMKTRKIAAKVCRVFSLFTFMRYYSAPRYDKIKKNTSEDLL